MSIFNVEVVMGTKDIAGDDRSEGLPILLLVAVVQHINHSLGVAVAEVAIVRRAIVDLSKTLTQNPSSNVSKMFKFTIVSSIG